MPKDIKSDKDKSLEWWNKQSLLGKANYTSIYINSRTVDSLSSEEIQMIWEEETDY